MMTFPARPIELINPRTDREAPCRTSQNPTANPESGFCAFLAEDNGRRSIGAYGRHWRGRVRRPPTRVPRLPHRGPRTHRGRCFAPPRAASAPPRPPTPRARRSSRASSDPPSPPPAPHARAARGRTARRRVLRRSRLSSARCATTGPRRRWSSMNDGRAER